MSRIRTREAIRHPANNKRRPQGRVEEHAVHEIRSPLWRDQRSDDDYHGNSEYQADAPHYSSAWVRSRRCSPRSSGGIASLTPAVVALVAGVSAAYELAPASVALGVTPAFRATCSNTMPN